MSPYIVFPANSLYSPEAFSVLLCLISLSLYRSLVFLSLEYIWQLLLFTMLWLALCFPMTPYFSSSSPLLSVRKGSPARVFVWWWDRFPSFLFIFHCSPLSVFLSIFYPSGILLLFLLFFFFFTLGRDAWYIFFDSFTHVRYLLDFPAPSNIFAFFPAISATKTISETEHKHTLTLVK